MAGLGKAGQGGARQGKEKKNKKVKTMGNETRCDSCGCLVYSGYARMTIEEPMTENFEEFDIYICEECKKTLEPIFDTFLAYRNKKFVLVKA